MRKVYGICLFCAGMVTLFGISYGSTRYLNEMQEDHFAVRDVPTIEAGVKTEVIISNLTSYTLEQFDADRNSLSEQQETMPIAYIGMNRAEMIQTLQNYMKDPSQEDRRKGITACELVEFSKSSVTVRKSYSKDSLPHNFYIMVEQGYLVVYREDRRTRFDDTTIKLEHLPEKIQQQVVSGLPINGVDALYDFLETYTS